MQKRRSRERIKLRRWLCCYVSGNSLSGFLLKMGFAHDTIRLQTIQSVRACCSSSNLPVFGGTRQMSMHISPFAVIRRLVRSEEHTSELQSQSNLVCRLLLEIKN